MPFLLKTGRLSLQVMALIDQCMKIWIVYDSKFGSNIKVADYMKHLLGSNHEVKVSYAKKVSPSMVVKDNPEILLFGGPLRAGNLSYTIRKWSEKFGKEAKKKSLILKKLGSWETKGKISEEDLQKAEGMEKKILEKSLHTPEILKHLMAGIPCVESPVEPLSLFVITPDTGKMSDTRLEEGYHQKIEKFIESIEI